MKFFNILKIFGIIFILISLIINPNTKVALIENFNNNSLNIIKKQLINTTDNTDYITSNTLYPINSCILPDESISYDEAYNYLVYINKRSKLPINFIPTDLVNLSDYKIKTSGKILLREKAALSLLELVNDLDKNKISYRINSGYRDFNLQQNAYNYWVNALGKIEGEKYAAPIGSSEHHLGTTIDIVTSENNFKITNSYTSTKLYKFLKENAYKYGFVMSYPMEFQNLTGFTYEPWHYRYIGINYARYIYENNISFVEFIHNIKNYCLLHY